MPRRPRRDQPGRLHHVMNRGLSRRPLFEVERDQRVFLAFLACAVRAGRIEVHAFSLMTTHFHLLVRSLDGDLPGTMRWLQSRYARYFNRTRGRDGPLVRGRFRSIPVTTVAYLITLIRYIDANALEAGLLQDPLQHTGGSAGRHAARRGPVWLDRALIDACIEPWLRAGLDRVAAYRKVFSTRSDDPSLQVPAMRLERSGAHDDELDFLTVSDSRQRRAWIRERALRGDGVPPATPMVDQGSLRVVVSAHRQRSPDARVQLAGRGRGRGLWGLIEAGLLRDLCGANFTEAAATLDVSMSHARHLYALHREAIQSDATYLVFAAEVARQALARCYHSMGRARVDETLSARLLDQDGQRPAAAEGREGHERLR